MRLIDSPEMIEAGVDALLPYFGTDYFFDIRSTEAVDAVIRAALATAKWEYEPITLQQVKQVRDDFIPHPT